VAKLPATWSRQSFGSYDGVGLQRVQLGAQPVDLGVQPDYGLVRVDVLFSADDPERVVQFEAVPFPLVHGFSVQPQ